MPDGSAPTGELAQALEAYLAHLDVERGLSANTLAAYRRDLSRYVDYLAARGIATPGEVTERDVEDYVLAVRQGGDGRAVLSASSAARGVVAIRGWHRFCVPEGLAPQDPAREVHPPARPRRLPKALSVEEVRRLLPALQAKTPSR